MMTLGYFNNARVVKMDMFVVSLSKILFDCHHIEWWRRFRRGGRILGVEDAGPASP